MKSLVFGVIFNLLAMAAYTPAFATMLEKWDTARLTEESKWIKTGEVTSMWSSWDPDKRMVFTYIKLRVDETIKGKPQQEILLRQPGGQSGNYGMVVHGMAHFSRGERALVFVKQDKDGAPTLAGMAQGKFRIFKDSKGNDMALYRAPSDVEFFTRGQEGQVRHVVSSQIERRVPVHELIQEIRASMGAKGAVSY